jgi:hypothetical protein
MSAEMHKRARQLIAREPVEGIGDAEREWLAKHLGECADCTAAAEELERAIGSLRGVRVEVPRGLASRTQLRVRMRAEELREHAPGHKLVWAITAMSWALGVATAPWVWRIFAWIGERTGVPKPLWEMGFVLWWAIPAMIAVVAVILEKKGERQGA